MDHSRSEGVSGSIGCSGSRNTSRTSGDDEVLCGAAALLTWSIDSVRWIRGSFGTVARMLAHMPAEPSGWAQHTDILIALRDLVAADGADEVVRAGLVSARAAVGADAAFWMDVSDEGLRMVASCGLSQPEVHVSSLVSPHLGLGGEVLRTGGPVSTRDYGADPRAVPRMRQLLDREGLVAAAAVPVNGERDVDSVIYVVSREHRTFEPVELRMLAGLASMTGVLRGRATERTCATEHSRLLEDERDRARVERELYRVVADSMIAGAGLDRSLGIAEEVLGVSLHLEVPGERSDAAPSQDAAASDRDGKPTPDRRIPVPGTEKAMLTVRGVLDPRDNALRVLAALVGLDLARHRAALETEIRLTDHLVRSLLDGSKDELNRLWHHAALIGMDLRVPRVVVAVGGHRHVGRAVLDTLARRVRSRVAAAQLTTFEGDAFVLWPVPGGEDPGFLEAEFRSILGECRPSVLAAGIGPVCRRAEDYPAAVRESRFALSIGRRGAGDRAVVAVESLGMYRLFAHVGGVDALAAAAAESLAPLLAADARDGSDLLQTMQAYLEKDRRMAESARALHVHVNTLRYRIERSCRLLGVDLDNPDARFFLLLALRLRTLVGDRRET